MSHRHVWTVTAYVPLSLPTREGFIERFVTWECATCPQFCCITGEVRGGVPLGTPEGWDRLTQTAAYQRSAYAAEAARQAHWRPH
jgi:hypothetical protein